jgi:hypothetical protein
VWKSSLRRSLAGKRRRINKKHERRKNRHKISNYPKMQVAGFLLENSPAWDILYQIVYNFNSLPNC